jgi:hypothetical protein
MLYVPLYAIISRTAFFDNKKYNYTEHVVTFTYILAFISLLGLIINFICVLLGYDIGAVSYINLLIQIIYISYCFKRLYNLNKLEITARAFLSFIVYAILYIVIVCLILLVVYLVEGKEPIIDFFKSMSPK